MAGARAVMLSWQQGLTKEEGTVGGHVTSGGRRVFSVSRVRFGFCSGSSSGCNENDNLENDAVSPSKAANSTNVLSFDESIQGTPQPFELDHL